LKIEGWQCLENVVVKDWVIEELKEEFCEEDMIKEKNRRGEDKMMKSEED
nr:hypothetical protein [Tanacetum cinerariifolium]GEZ01886.1 hypothetical protein [Tanacetum cinerariifolium]